MRSHTKWGPLQHRETTWEIETQEGWGAAAAEEQDAERAEYTGSGIGCIVTLAGLGGVVAGLVELARFLA